MDSPQKEDRLGHCSGCSGVTFFYLHSCSKIQHTWPAKPSLKREGNSAGARNFIKIDLKNQLYLNSGHQQREKGRKPL